MCWCGRFLSSSSSLHRRDAARKQNKHNDDNNGLGEISIHPVRSFPPLPPPLFKLSRKKSSGGRKTYSAYLSSQVRRCSHRILHRKETIGCGPVLGRFLGLPRVHYQRTSRTCTLTTRRKQQNTLTVAFDTRKNRRRTRLRTWFSRHNASKVRSKVGDIV